MRVPYSWLREVVAAGAPGWDVAPDELEQALIRIGHEVEEVITLGPVDGPLTVGRVAEIEELTEFKKPIRACKVDVGEVDEHRAISSAVQPISPSAIWWWWRCPAPRCPVTFTSPPARPTAAPPTA